MCLCVVTTGYIVKFTKIDKIYLLKVLALSDLATLSGLAEADLTVSVVFLTRVAPAELILTEAGLALVTWPRDTVSLVVMELSLVALSLS